MNSLAPTQLQAKDILKTDGVIRFKDSQALSQVISKLNSSHDAAFVFDATDRFVGVISPYYLFKSRSLNYASKLKSCIHMPQKIKQAMSLPAVAAAMIATKIHFLPVVDGEFEGIVTANRLLLAVVRQLEQYNIGTIIFSNRQLVTVTQEQPIDQVIQIMNAQKISKLPVVDGDGKLVGIITQYELKAFKEENQSVGSGDRIGEKKATMDQPVRDYMIKKVETVKRIPSFVQAVQLMIEKEVGSLVIIDSANRPISIVTKRDLLQTVAKSSV